MTDKNGTSYLTGKEKQTTQGILGVITTIIFKCSKETSKVSQLANSKAGSKLSF